MLPFEFRRPLGDEPLRNIPTGETWLSQLAFSPDGAVIAAIVKEGIVLCDAQTGERQRVIPVPNFPHSLVFSPDGVLLWIGSGNIERNIGHLAAYLVTDGKVMHRLVSKDSDQFPPQSFSLSADGKRLITVRVPWIFGHGWAQVWNTETAQEMQRVPVQGTGNRSVFVALSPDGTTYAIADHYADIVIRDVVSNEINPTFLIPVGTDMRWTGVQFSPDGNTLIATGERTPYREDWSLYDMGGFTGEVHIWDCKTGLQRHLFTLPENRVPSFALCSSRPLIAVTCQNWDSTIRIWNWKTGELVQTIAIPIRFNLNAVVFSPDGTTIAARGDTGNENGTIAFWRVDPKTR